MGLNERPGAKRNAKDRDPVPVGRQARSADVRTELGKVTGSRAAATAPRPELAKVGPDAGTPLYRSTDCLEGRPSPVPSRHELQVVEESEQTPPALQLPPGLHESIILTDGQKEPASTRRPARHLHPDG